MKMETLTVLYEPKAQPKDRGTMQRRSNRAPEEYPKYNMIPDDDTMIDIFRKITSLNGAIKFPECPIRKNPFYQLKARMIIYCIILIKSGQRPNWSYEVNSVQVAPGTDSASYLAAIELTIAGRTFLFHTPIEIPLLNIIYDDLFHREVEEFSAEPHNAMGAPMVLAIWEDLIRCLENHNWFIYEQTECHQWLNTMKNWYPHLKIKLAPGTNAKLATMLSGGPMIQIKGQDVCKFNEFRANFQAKLIETGHFNDFKLNVKKH